MNRKIRSLLFFSLGLVFLVAAPSAVLYSQGYRVDFQNLRIVQTGGFYFKIFPRSSNIVIIPEREGLSSVESNTDFFFGTSYVENLFPGRHAITISKEGYHPWRKSLEIKEKRVTEAKNVILIPIDPTFTMIGTNVSNIFPIPHRREIVIKSLVDDGWDLAIYDLSRGSLEPLISSEDLPGEPLNVLSSPDQKLLIDMGSSHLVIDPVNGNRHVIDKIASPLFHPGQANSIIHLDDGNLISYDYLNEIASILAEEVESFGIRENGDIIWLSRDGLLFENGNQIRGVSFPMKVESEYRILLPNQSEIAIVEDGVFHFLSKDRSEFKEIFRSSKEPIPSPDRRKLAYYSDHEINILYLDDTTDQPAKKHGESSFLTRFSGKIDNLRWLNNHYLIFNVDDEIKIIEIDDRDNINIVNLANLVDPKLYFKNNRIYVISDGNIFVSRTLLP